MHVSTKSDPLRVVAFEVGGESCALRMDDVKEILHRPTLTVPPGAPDFLAGFLDLAGKPVPVISLARLMWIEPKPDGLYDPLILLRTDSPIALLVDAIDGTFEGGEIAPLRDRDSINGLVEGVLRVGDGVLHLLDPDRLMLEEERRAVEALEATAGRRLRRVREGGE